MPAEDWPSFHWRPSTASTLLLPSLSMRQMPTTLTSVLGSAPTVSLEKSIFKVSAAVADAASPMPAPIRPGKKLLNRILPPLPLLVEGGVVARRAAGGDRPNHHQPGSAAAQP